MSVIEALEYYKLVLNILCTKNYVTSSITVPEAEISQYHKFNSKRGKDKKTRSK